jgi:hypothetical protein
MAGFIALGVFVAVLVETLTLGRSFDDRHSACTFPSRAPELLLPGSDSTEPCVDQPKEPRATTAMVLGIVAIAGGMLCICRACAPRSRW